VMTEKELLYPAKQGIAAAMAKKEETKDRQINIRLLEADYLRLQHQAKAEHRTVSNLLERLALEYLDQCESKAKAAKVRAR
jgi:hypothetical protein